MKKFILTFIFVLVGSFVFADEISPAKIIKEATLNRIESIVSSKIQTAWNEGCSQVKIPVDSWNEDNMYKVVVKLKALGYKVDYFAEDGKIKSIRVAWE